MPIIAEKNILQGFCFIEHLPWTPKMNMKQLKELIVDRVDRYEEYKVKERIRLKTEEYECLKLNGFVICDLKEYLNVY